MSDEEAMRLKRYRKFFAANAPIGSLAMFPEQFIWGGGNGAGVKNGLQVCATDGTTYAWRTLY